MTDPADSELIEYRSTVKGFPIPYETKNLKDAEERSFEQMLDSSVVNLMEYADKSGPQITIDENLDEAIAGVYQEEKRGKVLKRAVYLGYQLWQDELEFRLFLAKKYSNISFTMENISQYSDVPSSYKKSRLKWDVDVYQFVNQFQKHLKISHTGIILRQLAMRGLREADDIPNYRKETWRVQNEQFSREMRDRVLAMRGIGMVHDAQRKDDLSYDDSPEKLLDWEVERLT